VGKNRTKLTVRKAEKNTRMLLTRLGKKPPRKMLNKRLKKILEQWTNHWKRRLLRQREKRTIHHRVKSIWIQTPLSKKKHLQL